jgi:hypothetical protein
MKNDDDKPNLFGINTTIQVEDPNKPLFGFGNQPLDPNQADYQSPAIQQDIIFLQQLVLENKPFDGQAASRFLSIKQSLRPDEIQKFIPAPSYANLLQRDVEFAKSQPSENPSEVTEKQKTAEREKALTEQKERDAQEYTHKQMADFLEKRTVETKSMEIDQKTNSGNPLTKAEEVKAGR